MSLALRPKVLIVLLDGLGDVGACTPLQEASTPWMDRCVGMRVCVCVAMCR